MTSIMNETRLPLSKAAREEGVHPKSMFRWHAIGLLDKSGQRVRLEVFRRGGRIFTSAEALQRFYRRLSAPDDPPPAITVDAAESVCRNAGI